MYRGKRVAIFSYKRQKIADRELFAIVQEHKLLRNQSISGSKLPDLNETTEQDQGATRDLKIFSFYINVHNT